jgi:hypothetical protein
MKITDGYKSWQGATPEELVNSLWKSSWDRSRNVSEFMERTAQRYWVLRGITVRSDSCEHFIADLIATGEYHEVQE